jgi:hypothetical protein
MRMLRARLLRDMLVPLPFAEIVLKVRAEEEIRSTVRRFGDKRSLLADSRPHRQCPQRRVRCGGIDLNRTRLGRFGDSPVSELSMAGHTCCGRPGDVALL